MIKLLDDGSDIFVAQVCRSISHISCWPLPFLLASFSLFFSPFS
jgi:hypothetical protein